MPAAECLLACLGYREHDNEAQDLRATAGAMLLAEGLHELRHIRKLLTPPKS